MKTVYLVRHGESEENTGNHLQGEVSPLTERGLEQARAVAERAAHLDVDVLIASSMTRAQQTAKAIAQRTGMTVLSSELFTERRFPSHLVGKDSRDPDVLPTLDAWSKSMYDESPRVGDGEDFYLIKTRALEALEYLRTREESRILLVTHGFFMRVMMAVVVFGESLTGDELKKLSYAFRTKNTGITVLTHSDSPERHWEDSAGWKIRVFNDHAHLG